MKHLHLEVYYKKFVDNFNDREKIINYIKTHTQIISDLIYNRIVPSTLFNEHNIDNNFKIIITAMIQKYHNYNFDNANDDVKNYYLQLKKNNEKNIIMDNQKTVIGLNNYLFLASEIDLHINKPTSSNNFDTLNKYIDKYMLIIFPDKCLIYSSHLSNKPNYRYMFDVYNNNIPNNIIDCLDQLLQYDNTYYKTDSHINLKGLYIVYNLFISTINKKLGLNFVERDINILQSINVDCLDKLCMGIGDLTWKFNLGNQHLNDMSDIYYKDTTLDLFYYKYIVNNNNKLRILNKQFVDITKEHEGSIITWNLVSNNIFYIKNLNIDPLWNNKLKIIIFYDSFLLHGLSLYFELFYETYFIKSIIDYTVIDHINPDYVFEFRVERFLF